MSVSANLYLFFSSRASSVLSYVFIFILIFLLFFLCRADPMEDFGPDVQEMFEDNDVRGCSYFFGYKVTREAEGKEMKRIE
jgi:hypothetical protein